MAMLTVRIDAKTEKALADLTADGRSATDAVREALLIANRLRRMELARIEAQELASDPEDMAEIRAIRQELGEDGAW
jgi:Arc/MetJ-type ribon-helix-helix transcriptional regulator